MFRGGLKGKMAPTAMPTLAVGAFLFGKEKYPPVLTGILDSFL